eukprot:TRINITY_DN10972_c0_g1_i2.p1 TRINITY_DN10972_c0_g1~~TRINITY_DN10972_c0_g1_i2.p1  ORF type:complete len:243 (+),score=52.85 TRINITY_DN10972_c0_g1_i2:500-1228(+)
MSSATGNQLRLMITGYERSGRKTLRHAVVAGQFPRSRPDGDDSEAEVHRRTQTCGGILWHIDVDVVAVDSRSGGMLSEPDRVAGADLIWLCYDVSAFYARDPRTIAGLKEAAEALCGAFAYVGREPPPIYVVGTRTRERNRLAGGLSAAMTGHSPVPSPDEASALISAVRWPTGQFAAYIEFEPDSARISRFFDEFVRTLPARPAGATAVPEQAPEQATAASDGGRRRKANGKDDTRNCTVC